VLQIIQPVNNHAVLMIFCVTKGKSTKDRCGRNLARNLTGTRRHINSLDAVVG
jgi:hypothetical protein